MSTRRSEILIPASSDEEEQEQTHSVDNPRQLSIQQVPTAQSDVDSNQPTHAMESEEGRSKARGEVKVQEGAKAGRHAEQHQQGEGDNLAASASKEKVEDTAAKGVKGSKAKGKQEKMIEGDKEGEEEWKNDIPWIHPDNRSKETGMKGAKPDQTWFEVRHVDSVLDSIPTDDQRFGTNVESGGCMRCNLKNVPCDMRSPCGACSDDGRPEGCFPDISKVLASDDEERQASRVYALAFADYHRFSEKKKGGNSLSSAKTNTVHDFFKPRGKKA